VGFKMQKEKKNQLLFSAVVMGRVGIKKNNRKIFKNSYGSLKSTPSNRFKNWEAVATSFIIQSKRKYQIYKPIDLAIFAYFEFHFKDKRALPDTSNCIEGPQDVMEACGVYNNDRQIVSLEAHRFISGEEKTIIKLYGVENEQ
jgi:Holliday junction resolvase RusA-like endonuclease